MLKHILVAVDGSDAALAAYEKAVELAKELHGSLTALHVAEPNKPPAPGLLDAYRARSSAQGVEAEFLVREGAPAPEIHAAAATMRWDLLVIGTHGRQGIQRMRLGSVAEDVLHGSDIPVLVVRRSEQKAKSA